jgi:putative hydrolase of the HAD superfamily
VNAAVEVVVLDMGGVACEYVPERRLRALSALTGRRPGDIDDALFGSGLDARADRGELGPDEAYAAVAEALSVPVEREDVRRAWSQAFVPDHELLGMVRRVHRPTALFTNNGPLIEACLAFELSSVTTAFDRLLVSWRLGSTKPEPEAYVRATAALGAEPGAILFVDDGRANVAAAIEAGWRAHHYRGTCALNDLFESHGLYATA